MSKKTFDYNSACVSSMLHYYNSDLRPETKKATLELWREIAASGTESYKVYLEAVQRIENA